MMPDLQKKHTAHFLHLIMTLLTSGLWVIVWCLCYIANKNHNSRVDATMLQLMQRPANPQTIIIEHR